ncbi:hypothetical protein ACFSQU_11280 [Massilia sp. GCM10020059]|uniref:Energy transducer TonB n=1 Tax=Massilia agrisoli TaxID=2892444 RepID=A0ABS8IT21_9BURK|nr:hypothetical protein [Massilia agrisoli]MCC6070405.1 hypothetical protein [Massilia agrisoli]
MNANTVQFDTTGGAAPGRPYRLAAGLAVSLALHAVLLVVWRQHQAGGPAPDEEAASRTIAVWLRPPPPPEQKPEPGPQATPSRAKSVEKTPPVARSKPARSSELMAIPDPSPGEAGPADVFSVEPSKEPAGGKRFDRDAALRVARDMADDPDPAKAGTAVGQVPPRPYATETKLARAIAGAKRPDCKDGIPGGLLAPLILLMDKKDSGCKW